MEEIGTFQSKRWGTVRVMRGTYGTHNGPLAISLQDQDWQRLVTLSVNVSKAPYCSHSSSELPKDCFYVKGWEENSELAVETMHSGLFVVREDIPAANCGFVSAPVWKIKA